MGAIVAIGGGELKYFETFLIDEYIVKLSNKEHPNALFIPTASGEPHEYIDTFNRVYGEKLGCYTDWLPLLNNILCDAEIKNKILLSDIIYVGGGDTSKMMDTWRQYKVDEYLKQAYKKGVILSGLSAGSECWFKYGHSDSNLFRNKEGWWDFVQVDGLGLIDAIHCPHYNEYGSQGFDDKIAEVDEIGIALENNCAIVIKDDSFLIIKSDEKAKAYKLYNSNGKMEKIELTNTNFISIEELYRKDK